MSAHKGLECALIQPLHPSTAYSKAELCGVLKPIGQWRFFQLKCSRNLQKLLCIFFLFLFFSIFINFFSIFRAAKSPHLEKWPQTSTSRPPWPLSTHPTESEVFWRGSRANLTTICEVGSLSLVNLRGAMWHRGSIFASHPAALGLNLYSADIFLLSA